MNIIYLRKSRSDVALEELDKIDVLKRHKEILINLAKNNNDMIDIIFEEVVSGETIKDRPEMRKVLNLLEKGNIDRCYAVEIERLSRGDGEDQAKILKAFKYSNTKIVTPAKTYDLSDEFDENYFEFGTFMSRQEWKTIRRRLQNGKAKSAQEGKFTGATPPLGYDKIKLKNEKGWKLVPNKDTELVKKIYSMFIDEDLKLTDICRNLRELNIKTLRNNYFNYATLKILLKNPVYIGKIGFQKCKTYRSLENGVEVKKRKSFNNNYALYNGIHEAIISEEIWNKTQLKLKSKSTTSVTSRNTLKNPLAGILFCGKCGKSINLSSFMKKKYKYFGCDTMDCSTYKSQFEKVEQRVIDMLKENLIDYKYYLNNYEQVYTLKENDHTKDIKNVEKEIKKLHLQLEKTCELLELGTYTLELFKNRQNSINSQIETLNKKKKEIEENSENNKIIRFRKAIPVMEKVLSLYYELTYEEKNKLLKTLIDKILYYRDTKNHKALKKEDDFEIEIFMKI